MLSAAIRVIARTASLQAEEVAAKHAIHRSVKGKEREWTRPTFPSASGSGEEGGEKSQEFREAEAKIQKLLDRLNRNRGAGIESPAGPAGRRLEALPEITRVPKTIMDSTPGHDSTVSRNLKEEKEHVEDKDKDTLLTSHSMKADIKLPDDTREPKTILPSVKTSASFKPTSSYAEPLQTTSPPPDNSPSKPSANASFTPESIIDPPPAALADKSQPTAADPSKTPLVPEMSSEEDDVS